MAAIDDIKSGLDMNQVAALLGTDAATADQAVDQALESLLGTMGGNVADDTRAFGLAQAALGDHNNDLLTGGVDLDAVDAGDGSAILQHVYSQQQIQQLGGGQGGLLQKLLPILAPIVMAYIAKQLSGYATSAGRSGGGILGDILGGMFGGDQATTQQRQQPPVEQGSGSILSDILGSVFGQEAPAAEPAPPTRTTQPRQSDGPFATPSSTDPGLRMDDGSGDVAPTGTQRVPQAPASGGLGDLLRQILVGR